MAITILPEQGLASYVLNQDVPEKKDTTHQPQQDDEAGELQDLAEGLRNVLQEQGVLATEDEDGVLEIPQKPEEVAAASVTFVTTKTKDTELKTAVFKISSQDLNRINESSESKAKFLEKFEKVLLKDNYSTEVYYSSVFGNIKVMEKSEWLGWDGEYRILYQRTPASVGISARHWMVGVSKEEKTEDKIKISWQLIDNYDSANKVFKGKWSDELNKKIGSVPSEAIWVPYSKGSWALDLKAGTITYTLESDPGGILKANPDGIFVTFPNHVVKNNLGLTGEFKVQ